MDRGYQKKIFILISLFFLFVPIISYAADSKDETFFVKPVIDDSQKDNTNDYFNIHLEKNEKKTLTVEVYNNTSDTKSFAVTSENSITNDYGVIEYKDNVKKFDPTLKHKFTDLAVVKNSKISVPANEVGMVDVEVKMPSKLYDGMVLGGIRVSEIKAGKQEETISNVFSYVIPVKIYGNDVVIPNKLNFKGITVGQQSYENVIQANLQNPQPEILRNLTLETKIFKSGKKDVLYEDKKENLKMAPNSNFNNSTTLGTDKFKPGKYRMELTANANELSEKWVEEFEITGEKAKELNNKMVFKEKESISIWVYILGILIIGAFVYIWWNKRKEKQVTSPENSQFSEEKTSESTEKVEEPAKLIKKKRKKKKSQPKDILILIIMLSSLSGGMIVLADDQNDNTATATIKILKEETSESSKEKPKDSTESSTNEETHESTKDSDQVGATNTSKTSSSYVKGQSVKVATLPRTNEKTTSNGLLSGLVLCSLSIFYVGKRNKKESN